MLIFVFTLTDGLTLTSSCSSSYLHWQKSWPWSNHTHLFIYINRRFDHDLIIIFHIRIYIDKWFDLDLIMLIFVFTLTDGLTMTLSCSHVCRQCQTVWPWPFHAHFFCWHFTHSLTSSYQSLFYIGGRFILDLVMLIFVLAFTEGLTLTLSCFMLICIGIDRRCDLDLIMLIIVFALTEGLTMTTSYQSDRGFGLDLTMLIFVLALTDGLTMT